MTYQERIVYDARMWRSLRLGAGPLVPADIAERGTPGEVIAAALERLADIKARRSPPPPPSWVLPRPRECGEQRRFLYIAADPETYPTGATRHMNCHG